MSRSTGPTLAEVCPAFAEAMATYKSLVKQRRFAGVEKTWVEAVRIAAEHCHQQQHPGLQRAAE